MLLPLVAFGRVVPDEWTNTGLPRERRGHIIGGASARGALGRQAGALVVGGRPTSRSRAVVEFAIWSE